MHPASYSINPLLIKALGARYGTVDRCQSTAKRVFLCPSPGLVDRSHYDPGYETDLLSDHHSRPRGRDDVILRQLDDEWVIYDPLSQELHVLNPTAALVWLYCTGDKTSSAIVAALEGVFQDQVSTHQLASDVEGALGKFHELKLFA